MSDAETKRGELLAQTHVHPLILFDGVCGLCNAAVDWIMARDRNRIFRFAPLQGATAVALLTPAELQDLQTLVLIKDGRFYRKSNAALEIARTLPGILRRFASLARWLPLPLRDAAYSLLAKVRYRVWGKKDVCRLPSKEELALFFD